MNEPKFEQLMESYKDSLGHGRRPASRPRPSRLPGFALSGVLAAALIVSGIFLWPKDAAAAALERVARAIRNAQTMEEINEMGTASSFREIIHTYYKKGAWRMRSRIGSPLEAIFVAKDGKVLNDYARLDHATLEPMDSDFFATFQGDNIDALDFAKEETEMGLVDKERKVTLVPSQNGATYTVLLERPNDIYRAEIIVDKKTDLPISSSVTVRYDEKQSQTFRQTYKFNQDLPESYFALTSTKPVVDLRVAQADLKKQWKIPLGEIETTKVRDVRVTPDGAVWVAVTATQTHAPEGESSRYPRSGDKLLLPSAIDAGNGVTYARSLEMVPSSILGKPQTFDVDGDRLYILAFTPLARTPELPGRITLKMSTRVPNFPGFSEEGNNTETDAKQTLTLSVKREGKLLPEYFPGLDLDHFGFQVPLVLAFTRARAFEASGDWEKAGRAHEEASEAYMGFIGRRYPDEFKAAAKCYEKAGMAGDAERVRELAKQAEPRRP
jgi:hypothetical protein